MTEPVESAKNLIRFHAGGGAIQLSELIEFIVPITRDDVRQATWELIDSGEYVLSSDRMLTDVRAIEELRKMDEQSDEDSLLGREMG